MNIEHAWTVLCTIAHFSIMSENNEKNQRDFQFNLDVKFISYK